MSQLTIEVYREDATNLEEAKRKAIDLAQSAGHDVGEPDDWKMINEPDREGWEFAWDVA